jgi:hypothetical protein
MTKNLIPNIIATVCIASMCLAITLLLIASNR